MKTRDAVKLKHRLYWDRLSVHIVIYYACKRLCLIHTHPELKKLVEGIAVCRKKWHLARRKEHFFFLSQLEANVAVFVYSEARQNSQSLKKQQNIESECGREQNPRLQGNRVNHLAKGISPQPGDQSTGSMEYGRSVAATWLNKKKRKYKKIPYFYSFLVEYFSSMTYK